MRLAAAIVLAPAVFSAETGGGIIYQDPIALHGWDVRLQDVQTESAVGGTTRRYLSVEPGLWGSTDVSLSFSSLGRARRQPGDGPLHPGVAAEGSTLATASFDRVFARLTLTASTHSIDRTTNPDLREAWRTGGTKEKSYPDPLVSVEGSVGVTGLGHVLMAGNESFQWGPGIYGSVVLGRNWRGFLHAALLPQTPFVLFDLEDHPLRLGYELIYGYLDDHRDIGPQHPTIMGGRVALGWYFAELGGNVAVQAGGDGQRRQGPGSLFDARTDTEGKGSSANRIMSLDLTIRMAGVLAISGEYGIDDWGNSGQAQAIGDLGAETNGFLTRNAANWVVTVDWLDVTGDGSHRLALEWYRSMSYFYDHHKYPWKYQGQPMGHPDGPNVQRIDLLYQVRDDSGGRTDVAFSYRRAGWLDEAWAREHSKEAYRGGDRRTANRPWDTYAIDLTRVVPLAQPLPRGASLQVDSGISLEQNFEFNQNRTLWNSYAVVSLSVPW